jgi:hypothetical protein
MAWTRKLPSGRYQGQFKDDTGCIRSVGTWDRKGDAKRAADEEQRRSKLDGYVTPDHRKLVFGQRFEVSFRPSTQRSSQERLDSDWQNSAA